MAEVLDVKEQVERDAVRLQDLEAAEDVVADDEVVVGLVLGDVPDADELGVVLDLEQLPLAVGAGQVDPADDPGDERVPLGQAERPVVLAGVVLGLDDDRPVDPGRAEQRLQVVGQEVAADRGERGGVEPARN